MVQDPRLVRSSAALWKDLDDYRQLARLFVARALQQQARGDSRRALADLETALGLSRQVKNAAVWHVFVAGNAMEFSALQGYRHLLQKAGADKELLQTALTVLQRHEAANPDPVNTIKAQYLVSQQEGPSFSEESRLATSLLWTAYQVPWEQERQRRLFRAWYLAQFQGVREPFWTRAVRRRLQSADSNWSSGLVAELNLPPTEGPGSDLSARQWRQIVVQSWDIPAGAVQGQAAREQSTLSAAELATAAALYQIDHGKPPAQLEDLAPAYVTSLPIDPLTGRSFGYVISPDKEFMDRPGSRFVAAPGQAVVWSESQQSVIFFPVPVRHK
jgi:hypothetical protein